MRLKHVNTARTCFVLEKKKKYFEKKKSRREVKGRAGTRDPGRRGGTGLQRQRPPTTVTEGFLGMPAVRQSGVRHRTTTPGPYDRPKSASRSSQPNRGRDSGGSDGGGPSATSSQVIACGRGLTCVE